MLGQVGRCKYTILLLPGKSKLFCLRFPFHTCLDIMYLDKKTLSCFSSILLPSAIFLGCPTDNDSENRNQLPGWTLATLQTAQSMRSREEGGWGEPEHLSNVLCSTALVGVKKTTGKGAISCVSLTVLPD